MHHGPLIAILVAGFGLAYLLGALAHRLRLPPLVGYLLAGVAVGPFTPGFVADQKLADQLAEIGIILLMFGVGLHFSLRDLLSVRRIALPGAIVQIAAATLLGIGFGRWMGWTVLASGIFGLALSVASTVVLLRALQERHILETQRGRIAVGWLIVEDLAMVLALVVLPALAQAAAEPDLASLSLELLATAAKFAAFVALMLIGGRRLIPWLIHWTAHTGSRELFRLGVLAIALVVAFASAYLFDMSFALGAFFAGMILGESALSQRAAEETLPLRDAFAVLFFVSVGMLFDPSIVLRMPAELVLTLLIIIVGKSLAAYGLVRLLGESHVTGMTVSASLAQIGEFSFILATMGVSLGVLNPEARDLILASALLSIMLNPLVFRLTDLFTDKAAELPVPAESSKAKKTGGVIVVGYGRVGSRIAAGLKSRGFRPVIIDERFEATEAARIAGFAAHPGNGSDDEVLARANIKEAESLYVAVPDPVEAGQIIEKARAANGGLHIIVRSHSDENTRWLRELGASRVVMGEDELARAMLAKKGAS
jgi:CPA2 family monovalent cation:H+ antiporter-2